VQIRGKNVPVVMSLLLWLSLWEIIGRSGLIFVIPPFSDVVRAMFDLVRGSTFWKDVALSLKAFGAGLGISLSLGIPLGFLMGVSRRADEMMGMWVNIFISAPITALVPIIMAVFGIVLEMAHSFGASRPQLYAKVIFWSALPEILTGLRMAIIRGVRGMIVGQMLIAILGLGKLFLFYSQYFLMARFFSLLIFVLLFAWGLAELVGYFEQKVEHFAKGR
jgi:NitT/TauT family transport system permease protein